MSAEFGSSHHGAYRMPAEWERHSATWISWPHEESDWPGKFEPIRWVYVEIASALAESEQVEILCHSSEIQSEVRACFAEKGRSLENIRLHLVPSDRSWLRDSMPIGVVATGGGAAPRAWLRWKFNAWAKYDNFELDAAVPDAVGSITGIPLINCLRPDNGQDMVLEGGAIDVDGQGTMLTTEECLLSRIQERNPGLDRAGYEEAFARYFGVTKTIWLGRSCEGDDTHGHVDDVARFIRPGHIVLAVEEDPTDPNYEIGQDNLRRTAGIVDAQGRPVAVTKLPMPSAVEFEGVRLPASYANFYIANTAVMVPTFRDRKDEQVLETFRGLFPNRKVVGIDCFDLVLGLGTLHCLTQQQPARRAI
jgi:agmatine deiminase